MGCERAQDLRELVRAELAGSARPRGKRRQPDLRHSCLLSRSIARSDTYPSLPQKQSHPAGCATDPAINHPAWDREVILTS